jgi:hypothetical protein
MPSKQTFDSLAERIRRETIKSHLLVFHESDLHELWESHPTLSYVEKILLIKNFAVTYGFDLIVNAPKMSATFSLRNTDSMKAKATYSSGTSLKFALGIAQTIGPLS